MKKINILKKYLPINTYGIIRDYRNYLAPSLPNINLSTKNHFWFLDSPEYGNIGDQAIAFSMVAFLNEHFGDYDIIEFKQSEIIKYLGWIKRKIKKGDVIVLQGGGNLGNLYPPYEAIRRKIVKTFPDNRIVIFPQSCYFSKDFKGNYEKFISKKFYSKNKNVVIFARENLTYLKLKKDFVDVDIRICPDIVFYLYGKYTSNTRFGIGKCFRDDSEKVQFDNDQIEYIKELENQYSQSFSLTTICENNRISSEKRKYLVEKKIFEFAKRELVVTDRLHGMIFSYITKTPCIFFDSLTGKSMNTYYTWLKDYPIIKFYDEQEYNKIDKINELDFTELLDALKGF